MFRIARRFAAGLLAVALLLPACSPGEQPSTETTTAVDQEAARRLSRPTLRVVTPMNGVSVTSPFVILVEAENLELAPKGAVRDGEAHLHVITTGDCVPPGEVIVDDETHVHYGEGPAHLSIDLPPGDYDLCVQAGDGFHVALGITTLISVTVVP